MKVVATCIAASLLGGGLLSCEALDWAKLKSELANRPDDSVAAEISRHWPERPPDFFLGIGKESWEKIIPLLPLESIKTIQPREFENNPVACKAFARCLPSISNRESLPQVFRSAVYKLLQNNQNIKICNEAVINSAKWVEEQGSQAISALELASPLNPENTNHHPKAKQNLAAHSDLGTLAFVESIPVDWIVHDGGLIMKALTLSNPIRLGLLTDDCLAALFANPTDKCQFITLKILESLNSSQLKFITPECMAEIKGLKTMNLSSIIPHLPNEIFSHYNGPLTRETISKLSASQLGGYGSRVENTRRICNSLGLHNLPPNSFQAITSRCLYGYLSDKGKEGLGGDSWKHIPLQVLEEFAPEMQIVWVNIYPQDFYSIPDNAMRIIFSGPHICSNLKSSAFTQRIFKNLSAPCLHALLSRFKPKVPLEKSWKVINPQVIAAFTNEMMKVFQRVESSNFTYMKWPILDILFSSQVGLENLPKPLYGHHLSNSAKKLVFTPERFTALAKAAPDVAGWFLLSAYWIQKDILADCDGDTLRTLTYSTGPYVAPTIYDWVGVFNRFQGRKEAFEVIKQMSTRATKHLCATIQGLDEYVRLVWLRNNINDACRLALQFDLNDLSVMLAAPELVRGRIPWKGMLERFTFQDWTQVFNNEELGGELGETCEFWSLVGKKHQDLMKIPRALEIIKPRCVQELGRFLSANTQFIRLLNGDAFSTHRSGQLHFGLRELSVNQIQNLSKAITTDKKNPGSVEVTHQHIFSRLSVEEFTLLEFSQFTVLFTSQWAFVPESMKFEIVKFHCKKVTRWLNALVERFKNLTVDDNFIMENFGADYSNCLLEAFSLYATLWKFEPKLVDRLNLGGLLHLIRRTSLNPNFFDIINRFDLPKVALLGLVHSPEGLEKLLDSKVFGTINNYSASEFSIPFNQKTGFDRTAIHSLLESSPAEFLMNDQVTFSSSEGGPKGLKSMIALVTQLLNDIQRDILTKDPNMDTSKFVWGISGKAGFMVGLVLGKVFQLGMRLTFALDWGFYTLLTDLSDKGIEEYHGRVYEKEDLNFLEKLVDHSIPSLNPTEQQLVRILPRPERIRFTSLSLESDGEKAAKDIMTKTNLHQCGRGEGLEDSTDTRCADFLQKYWKDVHGKLLNEFKLFIREVARGLGHALPVVQQFSKVSPLVVRPFAEFFPSLLNGVPITGEEIIKSIKFARDRKIQSLISGQTSSISKVLFSFIQSLDQGQLHRLLILWTGGTSMILKDKSLFVKESPYLNSQRDVLTIDFCQSNQSKEMKMTRTIPFSKEEYLGLYRRFTMHLIGHQVDPDCSPGGVEFVKTLIIDASPSLVIHPQPVQRLFNSLVEMMNTPIPWSGF